MFSVLFANKFFFLNGGCEKVFFQERDYLLRNGIKVVDFSMQDSRNFSSLYARYFVSNINYTKTKGLLSQLQLAGKFIHSSEAVFNITKLIDAEKPHIAHLHNIYHQLTPSIISVLNKKGVKVVLTLHDGKLACPSYLMLDKGRICNACEGSSFWKPLSKNCLGSRGQEFLLMLEAYWHKWAKSYEKVDLFLSTSRFYLDLVKRRIHEEKIRVLPNGIDLNSSPLSLKDNGYALYLGRLSREKGIETLLKAHSRLRNGMPLKVVGTGPFESHMRQRYKKAQFLGYLSGIELERVLANASFVVVPSEWYENCPMVVLEAMAIGKAVIGSRIGGIPEQIDDGKTGLLFEMGNVNELVEKMKLLSENTEMRRKLGMLARKKIETKYSLDVHCRQLMQIYKSLLSN